jgi:hypothetical protein
MIGRTQFVVLALVALLGPTIALAMPFGDNWIAKEKSYLSEKRSEYSHRKEKKKYDFRVCREKATGERIAANLRAEFVHECVRERRKSELISQQ